MSTTSILNSVLAATSGSTNSGIDVAGAVSAILYADRAPERAWQAQQTTLASQTTEINQLQSESSALADQLNSLQDAGGALNSLISTSSNSSVVTASAAPGTTVGNLSVQVGSLAVAASAYSAVVRTSSTQLSAGSFDIVSAGKTTTIKTGSGDGTDDTLDELASSINSQSLGVTANVITDSSGSRLSLVAKVSGSTAGFTTSQDSSGLSFTQPSSGADASLTVDGVQITSASNTVTGAISGVTLNLLGVSSTAVNLTLAPDTKSIEQTISGFISAYNTLITDVNSQFSYDSVTKASGPLQSDSTIQSFQSDLLGSANYSSGSGVIQSLTSLGVTTNSDGTLSLDSSSLSNAVTNNFSAVQSFFQGSSSNGFVASIEKSLTAYTDPSQGAFTVDLSSISSENTDLTSQTSTLETYLATEQTRLTAQYNTADIALSQLPQTIKQLDALLNPSSSSNG